MNIFDAIKCNDIQNIYILKESPDTMEEALMLSILLGHVQITQFLLTQYQYTNDIVIKALRISTQYQNEQIMNYILNSVTIPQEILIEILCKEIKDGNLTTFTLLLAYNQIDVTYNNNLLLYTVAQYNRIDMLQTLLTFPTVDPTAGYNRALRIARDKKYTQICDILANDYRVTSNQCADYIAVNKRFKF